MVGAERTREATRKRWPLKRWVTMRSRSTSCRPTLTPTKNDPRARTRRPRRTRREFPARRSRDVDRCLSFSTSFAFFLVAGAKAVLRTEVSQTECVALRPGRSGETLLVSPPGDRDVVEEVREFLQKKGLRSIAERFFGPRMHVHEHKVRPCDHALRSH